MSDIEQAPTPGGIDFSTWSYNTLPERTGNVGWQPDLQDLIYTAINHVEGDYEDADENCAEQVIERLVLVIKGLLSHGEHWAEAAFNEGWRDREARGGQILNSRSEMRKRWLDSNARDAVRERRVDDA